MVFILSFLMFFGAAITGLLLAVDSYYARTGLDRRLDHSQGRHWAPKGQVILADAAPGASMLPGGVRHQLWRLLAASFVAGCVLLVLAL